MNLTKAQVQLYSILIVSAIVLLNQGVLPTLGIFILSREQAYYAHKLLQALLFFGAGYHLALLGAPGQMRRAITGGAAAAFVVTVMQTISYQTWLAASQQTTFAAVTPSAVWVRVAFTCCWQVGVAAFGAWLFMFRMNKVNTSQETKAE